MSIKAVNYALIGAAGFVAPRHMRAIKETGGILQAALDTSDSVGIIDSYFPEAHFFTEFERFDRHIDLHRRQGEGIDYFSICSPNHLHDAHVRFALRSDADAICEKPLVLNPHNIDGLAEMESDTGRRVNTILQLRLHPSVIALKKEIEAHGKDHIYDVDLTYLTSRGRWYDVSWKGEESKSGGIATNIGVHFFDMLGHLFGEIEGNHVHHRADDSASGFLRYKNARVRWFLSINSDYLPKHLDADQRTYRSITVDGKEFEFSGGFNDLHTRSYEEIVAGRGFSLDDVRACIDTVSYIRTAPIDTSAGELHSVTAGLLEQKG